MKNLTNEKVEPVSLRETEKHQSWNLLTSSYPKRGTWQRKDTLKFILWEPLVVVFFPEQINRRQTVTDKDMTQLLTVFASLPASETNWSQVLIHYYYQVVWKECGDGISLRIRIGNLSTHDVGGSENVIWKFNFAFLQSFFKYSKSLWLKMCSNYPGIKLEPALGT